MKKVIFDTDIGIDDAMALLFLHHSPEVELVAIKGLSDAKVEKLITAGTRGGARAGVGRLRVSGAAPL